MNARPADGPITFRKAQIEVSKVIGRRRFNTELSVRRASYRLPSSKTGGRAIQWQE